MTLSFATFNMMSGFFAGVRHRGMKKAHFADIPATPVNIRFWTKADIGCALRQWF
jgi:hypothetical protein